MFNILLSPQSRAELAHRRSELARLYTLTNLELAGELMRLVEAARLERPAMIPERGVYDSTLLWAVIPEIARRLGADVVHDDAALKAEPPAEFRRTVGCYLRWSSHYELNSPAWNLLLNEACNGNPLVYAVDRLCAGDLTDKDDWITRGIKEVAGCRGTPYTGVWTPAVMTH